MNINFFPLFVEYSFEQSPLASFSEKRSNMCEVLLGNAFTLQVLCAVRPSNLLLRFWQQHQILSYGMQATTSQCLRDMKNIEIQPDLKKIFNNLNIFSAFACIGLLHLYQGADFVYIWVQTDFVRWHVFL